jgi:hypothetical protein
MNCDSSSSALGRNTRQRQHRHARPDEMMPDLMLVPYRPNRVEPRCKKRRPKQFDLMTRPRDELHKRLQKQGDSG